MDNHLAPTSTNLSIALGKFAVVLLGITLATNGFTQAFVTNGLVAYYPFNGNANDASGHGINGIVYDPELTEDRFNNENAAYHFNGDTTLIDYGNPHALSFRNAFTLSAWIFPAGVGEVTQMIACKEHEYWLALIDGTLACAVSFAGTGNSFVWTNNESNFHIPVSAWTQVTLVYNATNANLFMNGTAIALFKVSGPITNSSPGYSEADFQIGARQEMQPLAMERFYGDIDDVRLYSRALTANEVAQLYAIESAPLLKVHKAVYVDSSNLWVGTNYQVQVSTDLNTWTNYGSPFTATNSTWRSPNYWHVDDWGDVFFRLRSSP